jgi:hypothetical protein
MGTQDRTPGARRAPIEKDEQMNRWISLLGAVVGAGVWTGAASADLSTAPRVGGEMKHVAIFFDGSAVTAHVEALPDEPAEASVELVRYPGERYTPGGVLDGTYYSARYGWIIAAPFALGPDERMWIELIGATPGLKAYLGGMRTMRDKHSYAPIFGTDGSPAGTEWNGMMRHDWFSVDGPGDYEATFRVYVGDAGGAPSPGLEAGEVTLRWTAIPSPGAAGALAVGAVVVGVRRRR